MSIKQDIEELHSVSTEIKRLQDSLKKLRITKKKLEDRVAEYLRKEDIPAVKDKNKGIVVVLDKRSRNIYEKTKKEREQESIEILQSVGVTDAENIYRQIKSVGRAAIEKNVLKFNRMD